MQKIIINNFILSLLFIGLVAYLSVSHSQEQNRSNNDLKTELSAEDNSADTNQNLLNKLQQLNGELAELNKTYASAEDLERHILWSQIRVKREEVIKELKDLINRTKKLEADGQETSQFNTFAREFIIKITGELEKSIKRSQQRILDLRQQRAATPKENLTALDNEIEERSTSIDGDLTTYSELSRMLESQGDDAARQYQYLDATIKKRAEVLTGILQFLNDEIEAIQTLEPATEEDKQANLVKLATYKQGVDKVARHLRASVAIMKDRGLDTSKYTQLLIKSTGELTEDIFQAKVALGLLQSGIESSWNWVTDNGSRWGTKLVVFALILLAFKFLAGIVKRMVNKAVTNSRLRISQLLRNQIVFFSGKVVMLIGLLVALSQLGIEIGPVLAGLGIAGFIVGFALQDTLSNFAAGMMILFYRPFDVGDLVEAGGVTGKVKTMNLVSTTITTFDNQKMVVPNSKIWGYVIRNITAEPNRRIDMTFGISYTDDIDHAESVLNDIVKTHNLVLSEPEPDIRLHTLGESSVDFIVRPWSRTSDYWAVYWDITREVKKRFDAEGISIPFPQRDVHITTEEKSTT
jgi:small conductance mechanosensitive channel